MITDVADILDIVFWLKLQQRVTFFRLNLSPTSDGRQRERTYFVGPIRKS